MPMSPAEWETLLAARDALLRAPHGAKGRVVAEAAAALNCSVPTLYRKLEEAGLDTGRKRRADAGESTMTMAELRLVSGLLFHSRRDNDKQLLTVEDALDMLHASGQLTRPLSPGRVGTLLREHHLHPDQLAQQRPAIELRSLHPNHVWALDASVCVLYYMKSGHLASMDREEFYRNKPHNLARVLHDLCTRYAIADHYTGAFKFRYVLGSESAQNLVDFFLWAVMKQASSPMHGAPLQVMLDPGAANKGHLFQNLCRRMQVKSIINAVGNARGKGGVEKTHDLIERHFEGRFRFFQAEQLTLDGINGAGEEWAAYYCAQRKHSRHGQSRFGLWMTIAPEQLRVPASLEVLREMVSSEPEPRTVSNTRQISFAVKGYGALTYDLAHIASAVVGGKVRVAVNAYRAPAVDVMTVDASTGEECWQTVLPIERDAAGFSVLAPVIGETIRVAANSHVEEQRNAVLREAYRAPGAHALPSLEEAAKARKRHAQAYAGLVDPMADVRATPVPAWLPKKGTALDAEPVREVAEVLLSAVEACKRLKQMLGERYTPAVYGWVAARFPEGVPESQLAGICASFATPDPVVDNSLPGGLRAVGGSAA